jgi:hypothetical protein
VPHQLILVRYCKCSGSVRASRRVLEFDREFVRVHPELVNAAFDHVLGGDGERRDFLIGSRGLNGTEQKGQQYDDSLHAMWFSLTSRLWRAGSMVFNWQPSATPAWPAAGWLASNPQLLPFIQ